MNHNGSRRYVIISPVRDESSHIQKTIEAILAQTVRPVEWLVIDDNSSDDTAAIVETYVREHPFIKLIRFPESTERDPGTGPSRAFNFGFNRVQSKEYWYLANLDGDVSFGPDYFEHMMMAFEQDKTLGIASGLVCEWKKTALVPVNKSYREHAYGAAMVFRLSCYLCAYPLEEIKAWDLVACIKANLAGYQARVITSELVLHNKPMDSAVGKRRENYLKGYSSAYLQYHPFFAIMKGLKIALEEPVLHGGVNYFQGYFFNALWKREFYTNSDVKGFIRRQQLKRMFGRLWCLKQ